MVKDGKIKLFIKYGMCKECVLYSFKIALIIGVILALINHFNHIFTGTLTLLNIFQIVLTFLVPYVVSTLGYVKRAKRSG